MNDNKVCNSCKAEKPVSAFYTYPNGKPRARCIDCTKLSRKTPAAMAKSSAYRRKWYAENREQVAITSKTYRTRHPEKFREYSKRYYAKTKGAPRTRRGPRGIEFLYESGGRYWNISRREYEGMLNRQNGKCAHCKTVLAEDMHLDHIVPLARGGVHSIGNVQFLCPGCNHEKGDRLYAEFRYNI